MQNNLTVMTLLLNSQHCVSIILTSLMTLEQSLCASPGINIQPVVMVVSCHTESWGVCSELNQC